MFLSLFLSPSSLIKTIRHLVAKVTPQTEMHGDAIAMVHVGWKAYILSSMLMLLLSRIMKGRLLPLSYAIHFECSSCCF